MIQGLADQLLLQRLVANDVNSKMRKFGQRHYKEETLKDFGLACSCVYFQARKVLLSVKKKTQ